MFNKYREQSDYHWREFESPSVYRDHVLKVIDWIKEKKVLDIGCGDGLITSKIGAKGIDTDEEGIRLAQTHDVPCEVMSAYDVKGNYDAVFLGDTLEHLEYPDKAIEAIGKITNTVYIVVPTESDAEDYRQWNENSLRSFMQERGWTEESNEVKNFRIYGKYTINGRSGVHRTALPKKDKVPSIRPSKRKRHTGQKKVRKVVRKRKV
jgi:SAM-dependent methyltransferase